MTDNFQMNGPKINLATMMAANLGTGKIGGEIQVTPTHLIESITKAIPFLGNFLTEDTKDIIAETYFKVNGTFEKPKLTLEEEKTLFGKPTRILEELVKTSQ